MKDKTAVSCSLFTAMQKATPKTSVVSPTTAGRDKKKKIKRV